MFFMSSKPKILFITRKWPPAVGGMEVYAVEVAKGLERHAEVEVISLPGRENGLPPTLGMLFHFFLKAAGAILKRGRAFDIIHLGDFVLFPMGPWARLVGFKGGVVISVHGTDIAFGLRKGWKPALYRGFLGLMAAMGGAVDTIIANSHATKGHCEARGFKRIEVVPLGVHPPETPVEPAFPPQPYVLFVGRVVRRKGVGWFVKEVLPRLPLGMTFKIAGTIWDEDERAAIEASDRTEFLGAVYGEDLAEMRRQATCVIMPNIPLGGRDFEGFGLTAVETGAQGGVLLAAALDGIVDAVRDGVTGFLLPAEDAGAWADKIAEISAWDEATRSYFLQNADTAIRAFYTWERVVDETFGLCESLPRKHVPSD